VLPNIIGAVTVVATLEFGLMVLFEAGLSFLGLGVQPPTPDWGVILNDGFANIGTSPWEILGPIVALVIMTTAFTVLGETMRDVLDPRQRLPRRSFLKRRSRDLDG
jgi:peptide/nickel transport system permease protein